MVDPHLSRNMLFLMLSSLAPSVLASDASPTGPDAAASVQDLGTTAPDRLCRRSVPAASVVASGGDRVSRPELMLASPYHAGVEVAAYWVSEKLDGVRAYWDGRRLVTRGGRLIQAPDWFVAGLPSVPLDGELWSGRGRFEQLSGTVRRAHPDEAAWREVRYMVFDLPAMAAPFGERLRELQRLSGARPDGHVVLVAQERVADAGALMGRLRAVVAVGGEGLVLHRDDACYRPGRNADLLKLKLLRDAEARVVGHQPGRGKYQGMLGALLVEDAEGRRFRIGTGFTDEQRRHPPPIGSTVTYAFQEYTEAGLPRFARFLRLRVTE